MHKSSSSTFYSYSSGSFGHATALWMVNLTLHWFARTHSNTNTLSTAFSHKHPHKQRAINTLRQWKCFFRRAHRMEGLWKTMTWWTCLLADESHFPQRSGKGECRIWCSPCYKQSYSFACLARLVGEGRETVWWQHSIYGWAISSLVKFP